MHNHRLTWLRALCALSAGAAASGCTTGYVPSQLADARAAYARAEQSYARLYSRGQLLEAELALRRAELAFRQTGPSSETRDFAYYATRKAQTAEANGDTHHLHRVIRAERRELRQAALRDTLLQQVQLTASAAARAAVEQHAAEVRSRWALQGLRANGIASVRTLDQSHAVISVAGASLFDAAGSDLLAAGRPRLDAVAAALQEQPGKTFMIEAHTSQGEDPAANMQLSGVRAMVVRDYLAACGIPGNRLKVAAVGASAPAPSDTKAQLDPERVDIVLYEPQNPPRSATDSAHAPAAAPAQPPSWRGGAVQPAVNAQVNAPEQPR